MLAVALLFVLYVETPPAPNALQNCECLQPRATRHESRATDAWIAEDKTKHAAMSFALTVFGYASARTIGISHSTAVPLAAAGSLAFGIAKEINDKRTARDFSLRDLVADAAGIALGSLLAAHLR